MCNCLILLCTFLIFVSCGEQTINYKEFKKAQDYTIPLFKDLLKKKRALFVFAHPDDEIACGGTIAELKKQGWIISLLTLSQGNAEAKIARKKEWINASKTFHFDNTEILDIPNNSWENVKNNKLVFWYDHQDSVERVVYRAIDKYKPTLIFTWDTSFGGYGHPEHRISAIAVANVFVKHKTDSNFSVEKVLQFSLPEKLENLMLGNLESYNNAKKITGNLTLPEPSVSFDISKNWSVKRQAATKYESQEKILKKFFVLPGLADTAEHYNTFDREYYSEIK